jgi:tetratricopeptide (TPR) repeat protein
VSYYLGAVQTASNYLSDAKAVLPTLSEQNALFLMAAAVIEPDIDRAILHCQQATELTPNFEIALYLLANLSDMRFRMFNDIVQERAASVLKKYDEVLDINPGNIAALAAQGYIYWLLGDHEAAKNKLKRGCEIKAIVR